MNVGVARPLEVGGRTLRTGIAKSPVPVAMVNAAGLVNDSVCNVQHHGGPDQAVCVYTHEDYLWLRRQHGLDFAPGAFGENLTIAGCQSAKVGVGDRFLVGEVLLEATAPRIPCNVLSASVGQPAFAKRFRDAERPGFYCRVVRGGCLRPGDTVVWTPCASGRVEIAELFQAAYRTPPVEQLRRHLRAPLSARERERKERQLEAFAAPSRKTPKVHSRTRAPSNNTPVGEAQPATSGAAS